MWRCRWIDAEQACDAALSQHRSVKGYWRRAQARRAQGRMEEAIKVSRYIRKLMSFFHPFNHRFSDLSKSKTNIRWIRLGCSFLTSLLASPDGVRFLHEDDFMNQIVKSFAQLDPVSCLATCKPMWG